MRPVLPVGTSVPCSSYNFPTVFTGGLPAVPGAARMSFGCATLAQATSVEP
jgi:hypothetical protein